MKQKGFSLFEMMIGVGLMGAGALAMSSMLQNMNKGQNNLRFSLARSEIRADVVNYMFTQTAACSCSVKNRSFSPSALPARLPLPSLEMFSDTVNCTGPLRDIVSTGLIRENAKVESIFLVVKSGAGTTYTTDLEVNIDSTTASDMKRKLLVPMDITTAPNGSNQDVVGCLAPGSSAPAGSVDFDSTRSAGDTHVPVNGISVWNLTKITGPAKAVIINFTLARRGMDREPRSCLLSNSRGTVSAGTHGTGDGGPRMVGGSVVMWLGSPPHSINLDCDNDDSVGKLEVMGVIY